MTSWRILQNADTGEVILPRVRWCSSFLCHLRGLMFRASLPIDEGLLFVTKREGIAHATIHMFFMRFPISVIWLDKHGTIVDVALAKPWRPAYAPKRAAQYYLEANVHLLDRLKVGDRISFDQPVS